MRRRLELGPAHRAKSPWAKVVNTALENFPKRLAALRLRHAAGLKDKGDHTHFDSASQREFGKRYAAVMLKLQAEPAAEGQGLARRSARRQAPG